MPTVRLLKNGAEAFPAMLEAVDGARTGVALEMYILTGDGTGQAVRSRLAAAARRGVEVRVLIDAVGSWALPDSFWDELRRAGGSVRWFRPVLRGLLPFRDHRKLLLVDDRVAFIGGMNVADEYHLGREGEPPWRDNMLEISGPEVARLRRSFLRMWARADRPIRFRLFTRRLSPRTSGGDRPGSCGNVRFLESGPGGRAFQVRSEYVHLIRGAERSIDLAMSYFFPPGPVLRALKRASRRGVTIRLLFSARSDIAIARWAARGLYGRLLRSGMGVWEYLPSMLHAKLAVIDDRVIAGSANLDLRSGRINYELVAEVNDPALAAKARADFEQDLSVSNQVRHALWQQRPIAQRIAERVSYWLLARADLFVARTRLARLWW